MKDVGSVELLRRLSVAAGPPGAEDEVRAIVRETLEPVGRLGHDRLGSIFCEKRGSSETPRVVVDSHLDEVGFMVQSIDVDGRLAFVPLGGWWGHVLLGQRVEILSDRGRRPGVIGSTPPHFLSKAERDQVLQIEQMTIDVGASSREQVEALGIRIGDPIVPGSEFRAMSVDGVVSGKAFDNRIGVSLMCETLLGLTDRDHPNTAIGVGTVQEEIGSRGAGTVSELTRPDVALILECTPADDAPGQSIRQAALGGGPQVRLYDPTAVSNRRLVRFVEQVASECSIEIQMAVRRTGGTDAQAVHRFGAGVPTVVIGVPARYIHSHVSLMQWADYVATRRLTLELVARLDDEACRSFVRFD